MANQKYLLDRTGLEVDNILSNAKSHINSTHAPSDAQPNQNAFSNVKVGSTTVSADSPTDTLTLVGSNITITPDATNDKITFTVANGTTSAKSVVKLINSTSSTSTTTAATPNSVKTAYDLANTAQTTADSKVPNTRTINGRHCLPILHCLLLMWVRLKVVGSKARMAAIIWPCHGMDLQ